MSLTDLLASSEVLAALPLRERTRLLERAVVRDLERGERLFIEGDPPQRVYLVTAGMLKLLARDAGGIETVLSLATPGQLVGEIAALERSTQPLDAVAAAGCRVVGFEARSFVDALQRNPFAALHLARTLARRLRSTCRSSVERSSSLARARLVGRLLDLADDLGHDDGGAVRLDLPLNQADLASLAGASRETTCKTLRRLKAAGAIDYGKRDLRGLRIMRPDLLQRIRCAGRAAAPSR